MEKKVMGKVSWTKLRKDESVLPATPIGPILIKINSAYTEDLRLYERACLEDPQLESFDSALQERTNRVIMKLASGESFSFDWLRGVLHCLFDMDHEVLKVILQEKGEIWDDQDLFSLVKMYFQSTIKTKVFCYQLENSLKRATSSRLTIRNAVHLFQEEAEVPVNVNNEKDKYENTLEELKRFKSAGDPFSKEFFISRYDLGRFDQIRMLEEIHNRMRKIDKRFNNVKLWRRVSNMVFVTVYISVFIFSLVSVAVAAPPVMAAIALALEVPMGSAGKWCNSLWMKFEDEVREHKKIIPLTMFRAYISVKEMDDISVMVSEVELEIENLLNKAEFNVTEEKVVRLKIDEIKKKYDAYTKAIEELKKHADEYHRNLANSKMVILGRITPHPTCSPSERGTSGMIEFIREPKSDVNPKGAGMFQAEVYSSRDDDLNQTKDESSTDSEANCVITSNLQNCVENKRVESVTEEKTQENVSGGITMVRYDKPLLEHKLFINFHRNDQLHGFVGDLVKALKRDGVNIYIEQDELPRRDHLTELLSKEIEESMIAIVIFSSGYAESRWCLNELVRIKELSERGKLLVIPIFYEVDTLEVTQLKGDFGVNFWNLWRINRDHNIIKWKEAVESVASTAGICSKEHCSDSEFITVIVKKVLERISLREEEESTELHTGKEEKHETCLNKHRLFGMELRLEKVEKKLEFDSNETRIIGVVGMPGIGKTTLAMMLHHKWNCKFIRCLPLLDIRKKSEEYGIVWLRKTLLEVLLEGKFPVISDKTTHESMKDKLLQTKVLIVLDDVSDKKQLEFLLGDLDWIKKGSKIVITTCDKSLLEGLVSDTYVVPLLNDREAFQLFNYHASAYHLCRPTDTFSTLSKMFVDNTRGHPLALNLLGRELRGKEKAHWEHKLATMTTSSSLMSRDVWRTDQLNERQKELFLDIVCFFKSEDEYFVRSLLDSEDPDSITTVSDVTDLANKFLITISDGRIEMDDLLYAFGKNLTSPRWLRLWNDKDVNNDLKIIKSSMADNNVRGFFLDSSKLKKNICLDRLTFMSMLNLRYIKIYDSCCPRQCSSDYILYFPDGLVFLLIEVRYLHWLKFPLHELPSDFIPENLVDLRLPYSKIERVWKGVKDTPRLKWVDLSYSSKLLDLSALSKAKNLLSLNLEGCTSLDVLPLEIQNLKSLVFLNLKGCTRLRFLRQMNLISLKTLILSGCTNFEVFHLISESLEVLHLDGTAIEILPLTIGKCQKLVLLNLKNCKRLKYLSRCIGELKALEEIILSGCSSLKDLSHVMESMKHIPSLVFDRIGAKEMPIIGILDGQASADMALQPFGPKEWPHGLNVGCSLRRLSLSGNDFVSLQTDIGKLYNLNWLEVKQCKMLRSIPILPPNLQYFNAHGCDSLERVANPLALPELSEKIHATFIFSNCNKLDQDAKDSIISYTWWRSQLVLEALSRYIGGSVLQDLTGTCFPGWEVPAWFNHQASGSVLKTNLPPHLCDYRFTGIALCAVISFPGYHEQKNTLLVKCSCVFINKNGSCSRFSYTVGSWSESSYTPRKLEPSHVFIGYTSLLHIQKYGEEEDEEGCSHMEATFEFQVTDGAEVLEGFEVLKCGFRLVCPTDERENISWDAKTGVISERITNIPGEATSYGNSRIHDDIQYESYSGLNLGRNETFYGAAKSASTPNLQKSSSNKKVDLLKEESDTRGYINVSSYHGKTSSGNIEKIKRHPSVGLQLRLKQIEKMLYSTPGETRIVGVIGMPGIGKTTLAKELFAKRGCKFPRHLFVPMSTESRLENLRMVFLEELLKTVNQDINEETTHESMKDQLLQAKVFVVLDDVNDKKQLEFVLGDLDWIKKGSKIVITTCDKSLLKGLAHDTYVVPQLNNKEAFQILTYYAFYNQICSSETFLSLSRMLVDHVGGNPLDLEVLGRVLCGKDEAYWQYELRRVRQNFNMKLREIWRFSIDQLNEQQNDVFLDIVYLFKSEEEYFVKSILNPENPEAVSEVRDLTEMFLVTISNGRVEMHDELYTLAKDRSSPRWHRLCNYKDIEKLTQMKQQEANNVRGIFLDMSEIRESIALECTTFTDMHNLLYLKIYDSCCPRHCQADCNLYFPEGLDFPLEEVRYLHWVKFPLHELPSDFRPENLVDLRLPYSKIERVWEGVKDTPWLKWVDLRHSSKLLDLSALSRAENLQRLNLEGCTSLDELPVEIQNMKSLSFLNLRGCTRLWYLPKMNLISLKTLILSGCINLKEFQLISESVEYLYLDGTSIKGLPPVIQNVQRLVVLNLKNCKMLERLPICLGNLKCLDELILSGCSRLKNFPDVRNSLKHLQVLFFDGTGANKMPSISCFTESEGPADSLLQSLGSYSTVRKWPCGFDGVSSLGHLCLSGNDFVSLQPDIGKLYNLKWLDVKQCKKLRFVPTLPPKLQYFDAHGCDSLERVANPLALPLLSEQIHSKFIFSNCSNLDEDAKDSIISYTRWRSKFVLDELTRHNKGSILEAFTGTCFPGWEVPAWFSHQAFGPVLKTKVAPHWRDNKIAGIALCAVISFPNYQEQRDHLLVKCNCAFNNEDGSRISFNCTIGSWSGSSYPPGMIEQSHVFIGYTSTLNIKKHGEEADEEGCSHTEAWFEFQVTDGTQVIEGCEVIKCGFSLYYATHEFRVKSSLRSPVEANQCIAYSENGREIYVPVVDTRLPGELQQHSTDQIPAVASSSQAAFLRNHPQIFVSSHGGELRRTFVTHLVSTLTDAGINVFTDNDKGNGIELQKFCKRIEESKIALVIFSERYIESHFCLDELVTMDKLAKEDKLLVIPVFYIVKPSDVKNLKGEFGRRFKEMRVRYQDEHEKVMKWQTSVKSIAKTTGIHSELYGEDSSLVEATVEAVQRALTKTSEGNSKALGGINMVVHHIFPLFAAFLLGLFMHILDFTFNYPAGDWSRDFLVVVVAVMGFYHFNIFGWRDQKKQWPATKSPPPLAQSDKHVWSCLRWIIKGSRMSSQSSSPRVSEDFEKKVSAPTIKPTNYMDVDLLRDFISPAKSDGMSESRVVSQSGQQQPSMMDLLTGEKSQTPGSFQSVSVQNTSPQNTLKQDILAHKRKALALQKEGKISEAKEALQQAKLLERRLQEGENPSPEKLGREALVSATQPPVVREKENSPSSGSAAPKPMSSRDRFKLQQESLSHKRQAMKLRREGKMEEAEAEFEIAKTLEAQ